MPVLQILNQFLTITICLEHIVKQLYFTLHDFALRDCFPPVHIQSLFYVCIAFLRKQAHIDFPLLLVLPKEAHFALND